MRAWARRRAAAARRRGQDAFAGDDRMIIPARSTGLPRASRNGRRGCRQDGRSWPTAFTGTRSVRAWRRRWQAPVLIRLFSRAAWRPGRSSAFRRAASTAGHPTKVTREHPKIDRIACPWLISRFIDPAAEFIYVPAHDVLAVAQKVNGTPYDIKDVRFGHVGDRCSFDAIVSAYEVHDAALDHLATIVRGADTSRPDLTPQCEGLLAISYGLSSNFPDDHEMLRHGMVIYDALYTWCRLQRAKQGAAKAVA